MIHTTHDSSCNTRTNPPAIPWWPTTSTQPCHQDYTSSIRAKILYELCRSSAILFPNERNPKANACH